METYLVLKRCETRGDHDSAHIFGTFLPAHQVVLPPTLSAQCYSRPWMLLISEDPCVCQKQLCTRVKKLKWKIKMEKIKMEKIKMEKIKMETN
jgi:hypothetical protein